MDLVTSFGIELVSGLLKSVVTAFVLIVTIVKTKGAKIKIVHEKFIVFESVIVGIAKTSLSFISFWHNSLKSVSLSIYFTFYFFYHAGLMILCHGR